MTASGEGLPLPVDLGSLSQPWGEEMQRALARTSAAPLREGNRLSLLRDGPDTYEEWLAEIGRARHWVHLENYIFRADTVGKQFAEALCEKASEGVKVRILYDWFGCMTVPRSFWRRLLKAGAEARPVNPPALGKPLGVYQRDHRKLLAVDGDYASTGGICIADDWMQHSPETGLPYRDTAVSVRGPAVADLERAFASVWNASGKALPTEERPKAIQISRAGNEAVRVIVQEPGKLRILRLLDLLNAAAEERIWIADAYFLSMPTLTRSLTAAAQDGVDVRILVPATNDLPWIGALSRTGYRHLLESGVRIYEYGGLMMHAKTSVADGWWSRIGSTNLNVSGLVANWEVDLVAEDRGFGASMEAMFEKDLDNAREVRLVPARRLPKALPERRISAADRRVQRESPGSSRAVTLSRVGGVALQKSGAPLQTNEHALAVGTSAVVLGASLITARFPRLVAWPLATAGGLLGGLGLVRAVRSTGLGKAAKSLLSRNSGSSE